MKNSCFQVNRIPWGHPHFEDAKQAEYTVFGLCNNFTVDDDVRRREMVAYADFEQSSEFFVAHGIDDAKREPLGVVRMIRHVHTHGMDSFATIRDARCYGQPPRCHLHPAWLSRLEMMDPSTIAELATQAIHPAVRRRGAIDEIWLAIRSACLSEGVEWWSFAVTVPLCRKYRIMFPNAFRIIGDMMPLYVGADSVPALLSLTHPELVSYARSVEEGCWRHTRPRRAAIDAGLALA